MKPVITPLAIILISISMIIGICDARILNVPEDFQTIQAGINAAGEGDTVLVQPGVYRENLRIESRSITLGSLFLLRNEPELIEETILDGNSSSSVITLTGEDNRSQIYGFSVRNGTGTGAAIHITGGAPVLGCLDIYGNATGHGAIFCSTVEGAVWNNLKIQNNHSEHGYTAGLLITESSSLTLINALFRDNSAYASGAIYLSLPGDNVLTLERVEFAWNTARMESVAEVQNGGTLNLKECYSHDNTGGDGYEDFRTYRGVFNAKSSLFVGTGAQRNPSAFRTVDFPPRNHSIVSCTFVKYHDVAIDCENGVADVTNSIFWENGNADRGNQYRGDVRFLYSLVAGLDREGILNADPLFLDPDNGDYHLTADSPCIDAGDPAAPPDPDGTMADIGAFFFHQRDIAVDPAEIHFAPIPFGVLDSLPLTISNTGGNDLLFCIPATLETSCIWMRQMENQDTLTVSAFQDTVLWVLFHPEEGAPMHRWIIIESNDPDEPEISVEATGEVNAVPSDTPQSAIFNLQSAYPNPFNGSTTIRFGLDKSSRTALRIYGLSGRLVDELWTGRDAYPPGEHSVVWNAEGLPGGVYLVRLESGAEVRTMKTILLK